MDFRKKHYKALRGLLAENGHDQSKLPVIISKSQSYCDRRMAGAQPWTLDECYEILSYYDKDSRLLPHYFPYKGIS